MKTQTKTEIRNNTAKATKLLRGIDNEAALLLRGQDNLNKRVVQVAKSVAQVTSILAGISSTALATNAPAKPVKVAKPVKSVKPAKVKPAVKAKPVKAKPVKAKPVKAAKPAKVDKPAKATAAKPAGERPPIKKLINAALDKAHGEGISAAEIYKQVTAAAGYFSRQSLYSALKSADYTRSGDGASAKFKRAATSTNSKATKTSDEEADAFVEKSTSNPATAAVS